MIRLMYRKQINAHYIFMKNHLQEIMFERNLSYGDLSKITKISKSTLYRIANFVQSPTQEIMICIAKGLGLKVIDVFNLDY